MDFGSLFFGDLFSNGNKNPLACNLTITLKDSKGKILCQESDGIQDGHEITVREYSEYLKLHDSMRDQNAYTEGFNAGYSEGSDNSFNAGYEAGYAQGYADGEMYN